MRTTKHYGMYGPCCAPPIVPNGTASERLAVEAGWRYHWGWIDGANSCTSSLPEHFAADYRRGWADAQAARELADAR